MLNFLNEKRHIAAYKYRGTIQEIVQWLKNQVEKDFEKDKNANEYHYVIPKNLANKIDIFSDLIIDVTVVNIQNDQIPILGKCLISKKDKINGISRQFESQSQIFVYTAINQYGYFYQNTFMSTLIHEINHKYEQLQRGLQSKHALHQIHRQIEFEKQLQKLSMLDLHCTEDESEFLKHLIYILFIDTEFNAHISSVYGDFLSDRNIRMENTDAYMTYMELAIRMHMLDEFTDQTFEKLYLLLIDFCWKFRKYKSINAFKRHFIIECQERLELFFNKIHDAFDFLQSIEKEKQQHVLSESLKKIQGFVTYARKLQYYERDYYINNIHNIVKSDKNTGRYEDIVLEAAKYTELFASSFFSRYTQTDVFNCHISESISDRLKILDYFFFDIDVTIFKVDNNKSALTKYIEYVKQNKLINDKIELIGFIDKNGHFYHEFFVLLFMLKIFDIQDYVAHQIIQSDNFISFLEKYMSDILVFRQLHDIISIPENMVFGDYDLFLSQYGKLTDVINEITHLPNDTYKQLYLNFNGHAKNIHIFKNWILNECVYLEKQFFNHYNDFYRLTDILKK